MDMMFEAYLAHESGHLEDDIPQTRDPVWILGKKYSAIKGNLLHLITFVFVYRCVLHSPFYSLMDLPCCRF